MDTRLNEYLEQIEKNLKPLPVSERVDIVQEIKSEMEELYGAGQTSDQILQRLGNPRELARAYLGDKITRDTRLSWGRVLAICTYYSLTGLTGLVVIPTLGICAPTFLLCGIVVPLLGVIKLVNDLLRLHIPYAEYITVAGVENPVLAFLFCLAAGAALCGLGYGCWKLLMGYIRSVSKVRHSLWA